ncbi:MAG TPA: hypothetical protein VHX18_07345 [Rhizomicrobium sp.]|jgi:hypothetical protein|nr:hypothetical protein [Rhizomicrobium sp.]
MTTAPDLGPESGLLARLRAHPLGRHGLQLLRWSIPVILLVIIGRRLSELGWREVWVARPGNPVFYLLLVLQFLIQPFGDYFVYRNLWSAQSTPPMTVILRKRVMNTFMLDYSGEVFFFLWAQGHLKLKPGMLVHGIKDSNVLSAGAALAMLYLMTPMLLASGGLHIPAGISAHGWLYLLIGSVPLILCSVLVLGRRKLTALTTGQIAGTFLIHFTRSALVLGVEFWLWQLSDALPSAVASLQFVALRLVVTRLPLVPNKDLVFVGAGIAAAGMAKVSVTPVATVLVILAAADLVLALSFAGLPWLLEQMRRKDAP